eukprot:TRINITY_DN36120_c0_g1_i1.p1 TRINITY_DN36120_c0_g1~~TRINITY_DN36120_c0_g1_i1.p1  ORF type:complete len:108 (-),score=9.94 TRINITY_DN36120_c0_g1_i1:215-538(-)
MASLLLILPVSASLFLNSFVVFVSACGIPIPTSERRRREERLLMSEVYFRFLGFLHYEGLFFVASTTSTYQHVSFSFFFPLVRNAACLLASDFGFFFPLLSSSLWDH